MCVPPLCVASYVILCVCRARDSRNRELFEKLFPELRSKRDQLKEQAERFSR